MKKFLKIGLCALSFSSLALANGGDLSQLQQARGTAGIDENDLKELPDAKSRLDVSREKMMENPRNPAMVKGFRGVENEEKESQEEKKSDLDTDAEDVMEGESFGAENEEPVWH